MKHKAPCSSRGHNGLRESVGEDDGGVGEDRGDDDGPQQRSGATRSKGERDPLLLLLP